ncbi:MAG: 16S rRNA (uracil(1498)-N(3))-methyltransferase [Halieaceae bacterium]|nr:16S rRNA (uracil(1498)-N(3))-methyltransferase [Halieaceae bacterium]
MRIPRIYTEQPLASDVCVTLEKSPSHHLTNVLRLGIDDTITLFNGRGAEYPGVITALGKKAVSVRTGEKQQKACESPLAIHLGVAISRGERMDWVIQKATELGVTAISPLFSERVEVKLSGDRAEKKLRHWQEIAISACEQCGRNTLPLLSPPQNMRGWLTNTEAARKFVLHHEANQGRDGKDVPSTIALLIGPEGGLSATEIEQAENNGYAALSLGPRVLRTETAPLAAIAILQSKWGDMTPHA